MQSSAEKTWALAQELLRTLLNPDIYHLWFAPVQAIALEGECITLEVGNDFCEVWLKDNYLGLIRDVLAQVTGQPLTVRFRVGAVPAAVKPAPASEAAKPEAKESFEVNDRGNPPREIPFNPKNRRNPRSARTATPERSPSSSNV